MEELRSNYYREMKKFISIPSVFTGFANPQVFAPRADRNAASLTQVYRKVWLSCVARCVCVGVRRERVGCSRTCPLCAEQAEILFARLGKLREK